MKKRAAQKPVRNKNTDGNRNDEFRGKEKAGSQKKEANMYPEEFEEFRSMDLRMNPSLLEGIIKKAK